MPYWLLKHLPLFGYVCPKCRKEVKKNSHECPHCGEKYPLTLKIPPTFLKDPKKLEAYVHKHVFPRISEFERSYLTNYFTILLSDDFASGDFSVWTYVTGSPSIVTSPVNSSPYAMSFSTSGNNNLMKNNMASNPIYVRAYFLFTTLPTIGTFENIIQLADALYGNIATAYLTNNGGEQRLGLQPSYTEYPITLSLTTWHCIELKYFQSLTVGAETLYLDGIPIIVLENQAFSGIVEYVYLGATSGPGWVGTQYVDDVVIADTLIGPKVTTKKGTITIHAKLAGII